MRVAEETEYTMNKNKRSVHLGPIALFKESEFSFSGGKSLEKNDLSLVRSLMYKLLNSGLDQIDLSVGLDRSRGKRQIEISNSPANLNDKNNRDVFSYWNLFKRCFWFC